MIELARGLRDRELSALAELESRVIAADGGRLKLEWGVLRSRSGEDVEDVLWWEGERLAGFLGLYAFGSSPTVELAGMVDPSERRRGIASALLDAALAICRKRSHRQPLLIVPRQSAAGHALANSRGGVLEHSEHALVLLGAPSDGPADDRLALREATAADAPELSRLLTDGFGRPFSDLIELLGRNSERTLMVEREGVVAGTVRLNLHIDTGGVYGFVVDPALQGRGIGRYVLRRVCRQLRADGARRVGLEVAVENDRALGLYTSLGFTQVSTEDYYELLLV
ncbi:MAG: GNAT family N-acetyltransferase [Solirubrobacteraceae bacterium]